MQRMNKCRFQDASLFAGLAAAVFLFAEVADMFFRLVTVFREPQNKINCHSRYRADECFRQKNL